MTAAAAPDAIPSTRPRRRLGLMLSLPVLLVVGGIGYWLTGGRYETTDNANLHEVRLAIASDLTGRVVSSNVTDGAAVKAGDVLFQIDPAPYRIAVDQARAAVATARLQVEGLKGAYAAAVQQAKVAHDDADFLKSELDRQQVLSARGVSTDSALDAARNSARKAEEAAALADIAVANARAALGGNPDIATDDHPAVTAAVAALDRAQYNLDLTTVKAPGDGTLYQATSFRPGQMVTASSPLFVLVETGDVWVDANFKETQLAGIAPGQPATVTFDIDPGRKLTGKVEAIGAGTGSEFSLLPAQNATGNWVKVTQRVPVRVRLDHPADATKLVSGMSGTVSVDTGRTRSLKDLSSFLPGF
jgi:membrane fusion protein (multidrug efflux system)